MYATAVVQGKVVRFKLSPALAQAHRGNSGKTMSEREAVRFVEGKRRARALRRRLIPGFTFGLYFASLTTREADIIWMMTLQ